MNRPTSGNKVHRRAESGGHHRQSSSGSGHHRSDSAQSCDLDIQHETKHHRSRSGPYEKNELRHDSSGSQLTSRSSMNETPYPRPTSLFPTSGDSNDSLRLEREPLKFEVNLVGAPPEVEQLVNNIKQVAEQFLYHWKMFPIGKLALKRIFCSLHRLILKNSRASFFQCFPRRFSKKICSLPLSKSPRMVL
uniref:Uncharacterized protein n=1 Tax=Photinus pyralis TaxID=7054 RepID=A0A1Y1LR34_PHOPY